MSNDQIGKPSSRFPSLYACLNKITHIYIYLFDLLTLWKLSSQKQSMCLRVSVSDLLSPYPPKSFNCPSNELPWLTTGTKSFACCLYAWATDGLGKNLRIALSLPWWFCRFCSTKTHVRNHSIILISGRTSLWHYILLEQSLESDLHAYFFKK